MNLRLRASSLEFYVDVRLRRFGEAGRPHDASWLAVADIGGETEIGLGRSSREALAAALSSLGPDAAGALLADSQLPRTAP